MKLLVQSDDYGFTKGVTLGILDAIDNGIITCTGLFVNMGENSKFAAEKMKDYPNTCFGIDFNIVSGRCVADPKLIPTLVDENGYFIRSTVKYADPRFSKTGINGELWPYEESLIEIRAQFEKYVELTGKKPEYLHTHSIGAVGQDYVRAISTLSKETGVPFSREIRPRNNFGGMKGTWNVKPFTIENQMKTSALEYVKEHADEMLEFEYAALGGHAGFVDNELFKWTTYSIIRCKDHEMYTSDFMKEWIKKNNVQLISYRDLK